MADTPDDGVPPGANGAAPDDGTPGEGAPGEGVPPSVAGGGADGEPGGNGAVATATDVRLQVAPARSQDVGKGVARLSVNAFGALGIEPGDALEIVGKKRTAAVAIPPSDEDESLEIIRLDGLQRANAGIGSGDRVTLRPADVVPARRVTVAPAQQNVRLSGNADALKRTLAGRPLVAGDIVSTSVYHKNQPGGGPDLPDQVMRRMMGLPAYGLQEIRLLVTAVKPRGEIVVVTEETEVELLPVFTEPEEQRAGRITYDDIGGLGGVVDQVREMIELPLKHPELFQRLGIDPPKGVLLHGPPGTGKTLLARAVAAECDAKFFHVAGPEIMGSQFGESEGRLREIFQQARQSSPSIVFIDEIDAIAPKRENVGGELEKRIVAQLLTLMDGLEARQNVVVIAATNRVDALDEALRRPGRFDREIVIGVPNEQGRREILDIHARGMPLCEDVNLHELAETAYGFVGADLAALVREAAIEALRRMLPEIDLEEREIPADVLDRLSVCRADFLGALKRVQPSALREIMIQAPDVTWEEVGGLDEAKTLLREGVELPLKAPDTYRRLGIRPAKGFLLYGPPGTGKTLLAKAVARGSGANFLAAKSSDLLSKWYGESEQQVSRLFRRARQVAPAVVFLDEIDSLAPARGGGLGEPRATERIVNTILAELDGIEELQGVVLLAATNRPQLVDPALLRPGRLDELVYVGPPDRDGRLKILGIHTAEMPLADDVDLGRVADETDRYTGADLEDVVRRAGLHVLRENTDAETVPMSAFEQALEDSRATVTEEMEEEYREIADQLKSESPQGHKIGFLADRY